MSQPIGILGGTFDPTHFGHLRLAEEAIDTLLLEKVIWMPAGDPALRDRPQVLAKDRLQMVLMATQDNPRFVVDSAEVMAQTKSFTVPSLERLRALYGNKKPLVLLVGADAFLQMPKWHRWEELLKLAHIAVAHRPGIALDENDMQPQLAELFHHAQTQEADLLSQSPFGKIIPFATHALDISATRIRALIASGQSPRYLLPEPLLSHIHTHHFYENL